MKFLIDHNSDESNVTNVTIKLNGKTIKETTVTQTSDSINILFERYGIPKEVYFDNGKDFVKVIDEIGKTVDKQEFDERFFVEKDLYNILHSANNDVVACTLLQDRNHKFVKITMKNGATYTVDVTGDSPLAMAKDVISIMMYK